MVKVNGKPVAGYWRVSRDEPGKQSPTDYERAIKKWAADNNRKIGHIFGDLHVSGKGGTKRLQQEEMLSRLDEFSAVVVPRLDRLSRNMVEAIGICDVILDADCDFIALDVPGLDTTTPYGGFVRDMLLRIGQLYLDQISAQWQVIHERLALQGRYHGGGATPFGYEYISKPRAEQEGTESGLYPDSELAPVVQEIFERYLRGESLHSISADLKNRKIPTRSGGSWSHSSVKGILENPVYAGVLRRWKYRVRKESDGRGRMKDVRERTGEYTDHEGSWEPIIDSKLWKKVEALREVHRETSKKAGAKNINRGQFLLSGLLRCGACATKMFHKGNLYICPNSECDDGGIADGRADRLVLHSFIEYTSSSAFQRTLKRTTPKPKPGRNVEAKLAKVDRQMERLVEMSLRTTGPAAERAFEKKAQELEERRQQIQTEAAIETAEEAETEIRLTRLGSFLGDIAQQVPELMDETAFDPYTGQFTDAKIQGRYEDVLMRHANVPEQRQILGLAIERLATVPDTRPKELDLKWHGVEKPARLTAPITRRWQKRPA